VQSRLPLTVTVSRGVNINARTQPNPTAPILALIAGDTSWKALALADDGEWVQIELAAGQRGWVARRLLVEAEQLRVSITVATPAAPTPTQLPVGASVTPTPSVPFATTLHRVSATDSLASIARQYYGAQRLWTLIYTANRELIGENPNVIPVGTVLVIPPLLTEENGE
jgi:LysM repeat protein